MLPKTLHAEAGGTYASIKTPKIYIFNRHKHFDENVTILPVRQVSDPDFVI